ncbi:alpha/beta hydrolase family esterase [Tundrisphaera sp. TA3]|uniref:alpha/beta hydrolase family esterase n=1 Tax=Tundrisphaera sp. TA3 TaxID=3435775 RepID=UPI003EC095BF
MTLLTIAAALLLQAPPASTPRTWEVDGVTREAIVHAPSKKTEGKVPLVFDFHGHGGTAAHAARAHRLHEAWPEAVVVYMQGLKSPGNLTDPEGKKAGWQRSPGDQGDRDLRFFDAVLASMKRDYPVDDRRVFATGHSNGGAFTYLLWATRGDSIAACAPVAAAAGLYFQKARPKPVLHVVGRKDPLVRYAMQRRTLDRVERLNGCEGPAEPWAEGCERHPSKGGTPVVVYTHDGGHEYPRAAPALIVRFFREAVQ